VNPEGAPDPDAIVSFPRENRKEYNNRLKGVRLLVEALIGYWLRALFDVRAGFRPCGHDESVVRRDRVV